MNFLLWTLQILLAFWNINGGIYTLFNFEQLKSPLVNDLPKPAWVALCLLQIVFSLGLIVPGATGMFPKATPVSAIYLAVYSLAGCALFAKYAGFPGLLWGVVPAVLAAFVAYGRMALLPF